MKIYIRNMVCHGTRSFIIQEMEKLGIKFKRFDMNEIELEEDLTLAEVNRIDHTFRQYGLQAMFKKSKIVLKIRNAVHDIIEKNIIVTTGISNYIAHRVGYNYYYLNSYFFRETGLAIEEYYISRQEENIRNKMRRNAMNQKTIIS